MSIGGLVDRLENERRLLNIDPTDMDRAERVLQKSEAACLISNSIKSKVTLIPTIIPAIIKITVSATLVI